MQVCGWRHKTSSVEGKNQRHLLSERPIIIYKNGQGWEEKPCLGTMQNYMHVSYCHF